MTDAKDELIEALQHRLRVVERRQRMTDRIIATTVTRLAGLMLIFGIFTPLVVLRKQGRDFGSASDTTVSLFGFSWGFADRMYEETDGSFLGTLILIGFVGLLIVAAACAIRLLHWDGVLGKASLIATWLLVAGCAIAFAILLLLSGGVDPRSTPPWKFGFGVWFLLAGTALAAALVLREEHRKWLEKSLP